VAVVYLLVQVPNGNQGPVRINGAKQYVLYQQCLEELEANGRRMVARILSFTKPPAKVLRVDLKCELRPPQHSI
jgi:hypothetical protein